MLYAKDVYTCFVDHEKAYVRVPRGKLRGVLREYGVDDRLLLVVKSLYSSSEVCVHCGGVKSQLFTVGVGLRQGVCVVTTLSSESISGVASSRAVCGPYVIIRSPTK